MVTLYLRSWQYLVRGDYMVTLYFHSWWYNWGGDYIVSLYFHSWQYLVWGWLYSDIIFSLLAIFGEGGDYIVTQYSDPWQYLIRRWLYRDIIFSLLTVFGSGGDYISPLTIFGQGVIISWHYIFAPGNIWSSGDYIVKLYFHSWQYLVRGWLYRDIFSLLKILMRGWLYRDITISFLTLP